MLDFTTFLVLAVILFLGYYFLSRKQSRLPPVLSLWETKRFMDEKDNMVNLLDEWSRKYPTALTLSTYIGGPPMVFLLSYDVLKKVLVDYGEVANKRPNFWLTNRLSLGGKGIALNSKSYKVTRRFALHSMKDFGLGKQPLEERIQEEARVLVKAFMSTDGQGFNPIEVTSKAASNIICSLAFGKRYEYSDPEYCDVLQRIKEIFATDFLNYTPLNFAPWLRHFGFLFKSLDVNTFERPFHAVQDFVRLEIRRHREAYDPDNIRDLVDLFIQGEKNGFKDMKGMDEENLFETIVDLFLAGSDTTSETLRWILLYLIRYPDIQNKCREEISESIGFEKTPSYTDRHQLPYTLATIQEVMRINGVGIITVPHLAEEDLDIGDYVIPMGSVMFPIHRGWMSDSKIWGDCEAFRPERFLDEMGQIRNIPEYIPFSIGKRPCPGEQLARVTLFINTVSILQKFKLEMKDPLNPPKIGGVFRSIYGPFPYKLKAVPV